MSDPAVAMLDGLEGEWRGSGRVSTPLDEPLDFVETIRFARRDATSLEYLQHADGADGRPHHGELGPTSSSPR